MTSVPPWPAEDHACAECGFAYAEIDPAGIATTVTEVADGARSAITALTPKQLTRRAPDETWSALEYLCHLRDVYEVTTIRLYRVRTEQAPQLEPMYNDLRAIRFRYAERDPVAVLDELDAAIAGCRDELERVRDWDRPLTRLAGEQRTARWLARTALHEGRHHLRDIRHTIARA
jgi:hypothetical protein